MKKYRSYETLNFNEIEKTQLDKWQREDSFKESLRLRQSAPRYVFYEGPPSANGLPGIHHLISRTVKDLFCRYKTQKGFLVERKAGWDTHGLPVELSVEKKLGITKEDISKTISISDYNKACKEEVLKFKDKWDELSERMGYWLDLAHPYITYETNYIESLWAILKRLYDKGLLYKSYSIQPYSPAARTGLSTHELNQPGAYKSVKDVSVTACFKLKKTAAQTNAAAQATQRQIQAALRPEYREEIYFLAWTTTPWTLPSNLGLAIGADLDYAVVETLNPYTDLPMAVITAEALLTQYFDPQKKEADHTTPSELKKGGWRPALTLKGQALVDLRYEQLFPYAQPESGDPFRIVATDYIRTEDGTGIVHTAPAFGADDFQTGKKENLGFLLLVDEQGKFKKNVGEFSGRYVKNYLKDPQYIDVNVDICVALKKNNRAFKIEKYEHNYPHCWRTDLPILYYPLASWFIKVTAKKDALVALNKTINWKPAATGSGRFGHWLEQIQDWNLSRSRFWGTPLPIWRSKDGQHEKIIGSIAELKAEIARAQHLNTDKIRRCSDIDLHKPWVDEVVLQAPDGQAMYREPDLVDVWFDSGAMPYAQWHYPFENEAVFKNNFPADFICEAVDQTRGWFYTLHALAVLLEEKTAYKNVVSLGLVLDKNGQKMSKRLGNTIDPFDCMDTYGIDPIRWYLLTNSSPWENIKFDVQGVAEVQRKFFSTLYNTYQFFALYANLDQFTHREPLIPIDQRPEIDRWILSELQSLVQAVNAEMEQYEATQAFRKVEYFCGEELSNWYVRLCRKRFWKSERNDNKIAAYQTLYECLSTVAQLIAPITPFFSEWLFNNLNNVTDLETARSVHHTNYPQAKTEWIDKDLEKRMNYAREISSLVLALRKVHQRKVRQPLRQMLVLTDDPSFKQAVDSVKALILNETNVKELRYLSREEQFITKGIKPDYVRLGKTLGKKIKILAAVLETFSQKQIQTLETQGSITVDLAGEPWELQVADCTITTQGVAGWAMNSKGALSITLDLQLDETLILEGHARELVNKIQNLRKDKQYILTDRIQMYLQAPEAIQKAVRTHLTTIQQELLCVSVSFEKQTEPYEAVLINELAVRVRLEKVS